MYDDRQPYPNPNLWPAFVESRFTQRTLAYYENGVLSDEHGRSQSITFDELLSQMFIRKLLVLVESLDQYLALSLDAGGEITCTPEGKALSIRFKHKKQTRWLIESLRWGFKRPTPLVLQSLRALFNHVGCGDLTSPGALGQASMRASWRAAWGLDWPKHRHQRPSPQCCSDLYENTTGARNELIPGQGRYYPTLIELDRKNAYTAEFAEQPTGPTLTFWSGVIDRLKVWVGRVIVHIKEALRWGCFPYRATPDADLSYPTEPGDYPCWLWSNEAALAEERGCQLTIKNGWGWTETTREPEVWVEWASEKRESAPDQQTRDLWKVCMVAAIGRMGMRPEQYTLVPEPLSEEDRPAGLFDAWIHCERDESPTALPHWMQYALARCRENIYREFEPYRAAELLVSVDTDAGYLKPAAAPLVLAHYRPKSAPRDTGEYGYKTHYPKAGRKSIVVPYTRAIIARDKTRLPGGTREEAVPDG